jgi:hypothetical protein
MNNTNATEFFDIARKAKTLREFLEWVKARSGTSSWRARLCPQDLLKQCSCSPWRDGKIVGAIARLGSLSHYRVRCAMHERVTGAIPRLAPFSERVPSRMYAIACPPF